MSIRVVEEKFKKVSPQEAIVVLESDRRDELEYMEARNRALEYAVEKNFPAFGVSPMNYIYPVDESGDTSSQLLANQTPVKAWRTEIRVVAGGLGVR